MVDYMYMAIVYFPFQDLYSLAYISLLSFVHDTLLIYTKDSSLSSWYQRMSLIFSLPLLSRSRHYSHRIPHFSGERCLLFIFYLCKPKTEVTNHSKVDIVEMITLMCSN